MRDYQIGLVIFVMLVGIFIIIWLVTSIEENNKRIELENEFKRKELQKQKQKEYIRSKFFDSDIYQRLGDHFQILFGKRNLYRMYNCSRQLASNFTYDQYRLNYLQKYFGFVINDETIGHLNSVYILLKKFDGLIGNDSELKEYQQSLFPVFKMQYVSSAGRNSYCSEFTFDTVNVRALIYEVRQILNRQSSKKVQRSKMTNELRESILRRDNWTCQICGNSIFKEPNLLLEVDHIIPIARGGKTEPNNLQTLCWRCNRKKSDGFSVPREKDMEEKNDKIVFPDDSFL